MAANDSKSAHKVNRLEWAAAAITCAVYFAYILAIAFSPGMLSRPLFVGGVITWGAVGGLAVIVFSIGIALWYADRVNRLDA